MGPRVIPDISDQIYLFPIRGYQCSASTFSVTISQVANMVSFTDVQVIKWVTENGKTWPTQASVDCKY